MRVLKKMLAVCLCVMGMVAVLSLSAAAYGVKADSNLTVSNVSGDGFTLTWKDPTVENDEHNKYTLKSYSIELQKRNERAEVLYKDLPLSTHSVTVRGLGKGYIGCVVLKAVCDYEYGGYGYGGTDWRTDERAFFASSVIDVATTPLDITEYKYLGLQDEKKLIFDVTVTNPQEDCYPEMEITRVSTGKVVKRIQAEDSSIRSTMLTVKGLKKNVAYKYRFRTNLRDRHRGLEVNGDWTEYSYFVFPTLDVNVKSKAKGLNMILKKAENVKNYTVYVGTFGEKSFKKTMTVKVSGKKKAFDIKKYGKKKLKAGKEYLIKAVANIKDGSRVYPSVQSSTRISMAAR